MNKADFIAAVAGKSGLSKKEAENAVIAFTEVVTEALVKGDKVQLMGFGTFEVRERAEHTGINPATMKQITVPASKKPAFRAGKALKDAVK